MRTAQTLTDSTAWSDLVNLVAIQYGIAAVDQQSGCPDPLSLFAVSRPHVMLAHSFDNAAP